MQVHQTLHGYQEGHRLLAASIDLPRDARYAMSTLSDMSGRSIVAGFEEYLTAYPIPQSRYYGLAKTWYAAEMERPGCVWTHTLLLDEEQIGNIRPAELQSLFRRPLARGSWSEYQTMLAIPTAVSPTIWIKPAQEILATSILYHLYGETSDVPIFITAQNSRDFEHLLLAVWAEQWDGLRRNFSFCTGSISSRAVDERPMDLQVVPEQTARAVRREVRGACFVEFQDQLVDPQHETWISVALAGLMLGTGSVFYRESRRLHSRLGGRQFFKPIAQLIELSSENTDASYKEILEAIAVAHPNPDDARYLKSLMAGPSPALAQAFFGEMSDAEVLRALSEVHGDNGFDSTVLELKERSTTLWQQDPEDAQQLLSFLMRNDHGEIGQQILANLLETVTLDEAIRLSAHIPGMLATFVRRSPDLAADERLWQLPPNIQREVFDAATIDTSISAELIRLVVNSMLDAGADAAADAAISRFGEDVAYAVLDWFNAKGCQRGNTLSPLWKRAIQSQPGSAIKWLTLAPYPTEASMVLIGTLLNPRSSEVRSAGIDIWLRELDPTRCRVNQRERANLDAALLSRALEEPITGAFRLAVASFASVHNALASNELEYSAWELLSWRLPTLSWGRNWDRCERLRRGVAQAFVANGWPPLKFIRCADNLVTLGQLIRSCREVRGGKEFLRLLQRAAVAQAGELTPDQTRVVEES